MIPVSDSVLLCLEAGEPRKSILAAGAKLDSMIRENYETVVGNQ